VNQVKLTIRIAPKVMERLREYHLAQSKRREALSYIWARAIVTRKGVWVVVPHNAPLKLLAADCFTHQSVGNVQLRSDVLNGMMISFAATDYNCLINIHDHWFADEASFSGIDDKDDLVFDQYIRESFEPMLSKSPNIGPSRAIFNLSVVLAQRGVAARLVTNQKREKFLNATHFNEIGDRFDPLLARQSVETNPAFKKYSRQRNFISTENQMLLGEMTIALVGCGGLGSILAESLARSGIGGLTLIDDDELSESNLNRWQGGQPDKIGELKAKLLAANLRRMFPDLRLVVLNKQLYEAAIEPALASADLIVAGLDNDEGRYFLNRVSLQYSIPYFDAGTLITGKEDSLDFKSRYFAVIPGETACLECSQIVLFDRSSTLNAFLDTDTAEARRQAGYVNEQPDVSAPSVYGLNQRIASLLVIELLNYVCNWRPLATSIIESWRDGSFERLSRDNFPEKPDVECAVCGYYAGATNTERLPRPRVFHKDQNG